MKNAIKYLVLGASSIICFVMLVLMVALLLDIGSLSYPATLILPMISYALFIGGFVMLTVWAFKFSSNKEHKNFLIISLAVFLASAVVFLSAKIINPIISETKDIYFDFTTNEIVNELKTCSIDFTQISVVDDEDKNIKTYISTRDAFTTDNEENYATMHYSIVCNKKTDEVLSVSCNIDKNSTKATERFFYNLFAIASSIDPSEDTDAITKSIINENAEIDGVYVGNQYMITAYILGNDYHAYIIPTENTKGD